MTDPVKAAALAVLNNLIAIFGDDIENDEPIDGGDAVEEIVALYQQAKEVVALAPEAPPPLVAVFVGEGAVRSVAIRGLPAADCVVVNYDDRTEVGKDATREDIERKKLGMTLLEFEKNATTIW